jgi:hypothetical protein
MKKFGENIPGSDQENKNKRRWLRFEFVSPVLFRLISIEEGKPKFESNIERKGQMLDISAGGTLLTTNQPVAEGNLISLTLNLRGLKGLKGILGKVKKVEESEEGDFLMGIEFCSLEAFPHLHQEILAEKEIESFDKKVKGVISRYILAESRKVKERVKI